MPYPGSAKRNRRRGPSEAQLRHMYRMAVRDARAHGERDILSYAAWKRVVQLQARLAARDPGGDIRL